MLADLCKCQAKLGGEGAPGKSQNLLIYWSKVNNTAFSSIVLKCRPGCSGAMRACGAANAAGPTWSVRLAAPGAGLRAEALRRVAIGR